MKYLTTNGRDAQSGPLKVLTVEIENTSDTPQSIFLLRSAAKYAKTDGVITDGDTCVLLQNPFFERLEQLVDFVEACPTQLHVVTVQPIFSDKTADLVAQTTKSIRLLTPTFGPELVEEIESQPIQGGANFPLSNFYLGGISELEVTIQPKSKIRLTLHFGGYLTDRLVSNV